MNRLEIIEVTKAHWRQYHPESYKQLMAESRLEKEANAAASLTLAEMDVLEKTYNMTPMESWQASRELFCLKDPMEQ